MRGLRLRYCINCSHFQDTFECINPKDLTPEEYQEVLKSHMFLKQKRDQTFKAMWSWEVMNSAARLTSWTQHRQQLHWNLFYLQLSLTPMSDMTWQLSTYPTHLSRLALKMTKTNQAHFSPMASHNGIFETLINTDAPRQPTTPSDTRASSHLLLLCTTTPHSC